MKGLVPMASVNEISGSISSKQVRLFSEVKKGYTYFKDNDVLFAKITPCMENGKAAIANGLVGGIGFGSTEFHVLRTREEMLPSWIFYFVRRQQFRDAAKRNFTGTAGQQRVPTDFVSDAQISVPPLAEQSRLVDILTRAEGIVRLRREALKKVQEIIPALFVDMFGDPATNPKGWPLKSVGDICSYTRYGPRFHDRDYSIDGAHILRTTDMGYSGELRWQDSPILSMSEGELEKYSLRAGTLLVTRTGATIGKVALFEGATRPCIAGAYLIELGFTDEVIPEFVLHFFLSSFGQALLTSGSRAVAQPNINVPTIKAIRIPLPGLNIQREFAKNIERINSIQSQATRALATAEATFQSLLHRAFAGEL
ncbi:restriction endonuclease subunit S [Methylomagnum ishizawai]|uniref:restriction endonuclease subunit S n=1 Tax=Methylomagnum ishizawai TaxID=1760988 RepID=UPI001C32E107|nr:restriction endonuclease subunit S [Methylomagnum ishizawai]BBL75751.1 hypothetical protein MishRS11D_28490 [Methylomagnum ishizawai]